MAQELLMAASECECLTAVSSAASATASESAVAWAMGTFKAALQRLSRITVLCAGSTERPMTTHESDDFSSEFVIVISSVIYHLSLKVISHHSHNYWQ